MERSRAGERRSEGGPREKSWSGGRATVQAPVWALSAVTGTIVNPVLAADERFLCYSKVIQKAKKYWQSLRQFFES